MLFKIIYTDIRSVNDGKMLDCFEIVTTSGVVLWSKQYAPVGVNIINSLIKDVFIEDKTPRGQNTPFNDASATQNPPYRKDKYTLKWTTAKDLGLIFVVGISWLVESCNRRLKLTARVGRLPVAHTSILDRQAARQCQNPLHKSLSASVQEAKHDRD